MSHNLPPDVSGERLEREAVGPPRCKQCGTELEWVHCYEIDCDEGYYDAYEEDPLWYDPGDLVTCGTCAGQGGWLVCTRCHPEAVDG